MILFDLRMALSLGRPFLVALAVALAVAVGLAWAGLRPGLVVVFGAAFGVMWLLREAVGYIRCERDERAKQMGGR